MSDRSATSAATSEAATTALHGLLDAVAIYERAGRLAYHCRRCGHAEDKKWEGACPGCNGHYNSLESTNRDGLKETIIDATARYVAAVKNISGYSWKIVHNASGVPLLPNQEQK